MLSVQESRKPRRRSFSMGPRFREGDDDVGANGKTKQQQHEQFLGSAHKIF
jgi:hypothetical protein